MTQALDALRIVAARVNATVPGLEHAEDPVSLGIAVELAEAPLTQGDQVLFQR